MNNAYGTLNKVRVDEIMNIFGGRILHNWFKKLCYLFVLILDGDIVFINSIFYPLLKVLNKFVRPLLSACAYSKLVACFLRGLC